MKFSLANSLVFIILFLISCSESDTEKNLTFEEALAQVSIENAEFIKEEIPSPTADEETLSLDETYDNIQLNARPGETLVISALLKNGLANGFLLSIEGISGYFVTYSSQASNGRVKENSYASFRLGIPSKMKSGAFKIQFSVYNEAGEISNRINQMIHVSLKTNDFLGGVERWTATRYQLYSEDVLIGDSSISNPINWDVYVQFYCIEQEETLFLPYIRHTRTEINLNLMRDNNFIEENIYASRSIDEEATYSSCSIVMEQDTITGGNNSSGTWSYNQDAQELSLTYTHSNGMEQEPYTLTYHTLLENNTLFLSTYLWKDYEHGDVFGRRVYIPKN